MAITFTYHAVFVGDSNTDSRFIHHETESVAYNKEKKFEAVEQAARVHMGG